MKYLCPVCGYNELDDLPNRYNICPSCGTEFDSDDLILSHSELRKQWTENGMQWWSEYVAPPAGWNPILQLLKLVTHNTSIPATYKTKEFKLPDFLASVMRTNSTVKVYQHGVPVEV